ncbi:MAG: NAD+ synthase, partial [Desulfobulbaceae bacterium]|nr:NAD+ synthase [Desulfobulbaceae bacterium]
MKIALVQTNPVIGAFTDNIKKIQSWTAQAREQNCDLVIFPELAICGYPPQDLLEHHSFLDAHDRALKELMDQCPGIGVLCGGISRHTAPKGKSLHNSAFLFQDGEILFTSHKKLLPSYDVFDENRYFEPGETSQSFDFAGMRLGITICEDIFNDKETFPHPLYQSDPVAALFAEHAKKPNLLINIAASPYTMGKAALRRKIFSQLCAKYQLPLLYVNQVGGQDSILFDGRCLVMNQNGHLIRSAAPFVEEMLIIDTDLMIDSAKPIQPKRDETPEVLTALVMGTRDYVHKCGFKKAIIGLSGGIDSALTAAIASQALGHQNIMGVAPGPGWQWLRSGPNQY